MPAAASCATPPVPKEKKTLERQIKDQDDLINRYQADLTKRGG